MFLNTFKGVVKIKKHLFKSYFNIKVQKAFSVAEAMVALLVGSIALGMAAPMITKQIRQNNFVDAEQRIIRNQIDNIIPEGAIMFFNARRCPTGWAPVTNLGGYYPRIANVDADGTYNDDYNNGDLIEQMVHKHKHVSPYLQALNAESEVNSFRYGPFQNSNYRANGKNHQVCGDYPDCNLNNANYPELSATKGNSSGENQSDYNISVSAGYLLRSFLNSGQDWNNWYTFTSDGVNREEYLSVSGGEAVKIPVCPNRSEDDDINGCKATYSYKAKYDDKTRTIFVENQPYLKNMPLIGDENRPNSVVWLACQKINN